MSTKLCFVIMGYQKKRHPKTRRYYDLDQTYTEIIKPAAEKCGYICIRGDEINHSGNIDPKMYRLLIHADLVIADISTLNANAIYELGIRHTARPSSTIIMKINQGKIPFDLAPNSVFLYEHLGKDISVKECRRCLRELSARIQKVEEKKAIDSPFFSHIPTASAHVLSESEKQGLIELIAKNQSNQYAMCQQAKTLMSQKKYAEAAKLWCKITRLQPGESYYVQQLAICTYKSNAPTKKAALLDALVIINSINHETENLNDSETLGIFGTIYKKLWYIDQNINYLNRAIDFYERAFKINSDYSTGENYALCLSIKANLDIDEKEKIYLDIEARRTREKIISIIKDIKKDNSFKLRNDINWIHATLANCYFALGNGEIAQKYETQFKENSVVLSEIKSYEESKSILHSVINF